LALSGALTRTGETPQFLGFPPADILTAAHTAFAIMVALHHRAAHPPQSPDQAIMLDAAMSDSALSLMTSVFARQQRTGTEPPLDFPMGDNWVFETADQRHVAATNMERPFWDRFCTLVDRPDLIGRFAGGDRAALRQELQEIYLTRTRGEWDAFAAKHDLQIAPVLSPAEALADPHHHARGALHQMGDVVIPGRPVRMTGVPDTASSPSQKGAEA
jgi:crotonobetainyl-CoA:carnitine CoA-transferase CaiB-like acyl-CoA transferase